MDIVIELDRNQLLLIKAGQDQQEIENNKENCDQILKWQNGKLVAYEKIEKYRA